MTFRIDEGLLARVEQAAVDASKSRSEYIVSVLDAGGGATPDHQVETHRVRTMAARILELEATIRDLRDDLKQKRREVQTETGSTLAGSKSKRRTDRKVLPAAGLSQSLSPTREAPAASEDCAHPARWRRAALCLQCNKRRQESGEWV